MIACRISASVFSIFLVWPTAVTSATAKSAKRIACLMVAELYCNSELHDPTSALTSHALPFAGVQQSNPDSINVVFRLLNQVHAVVTPQ